MSMCYMQDFSKGCFNMEDWLTLLLFSFVSGAHFLTLTLFSFSLSVTMAFFQCKPLVLMERWIPLSENIGYNTIITH